MHSSHAGLIRPNRDGTNQGSDITQWVPLLPDIRDSEALLSPTITFNYTLIRNKRYHCFVSIFFAQPCT